MNTQTSHPMGPNVRRFVRSAWLLLIAQLLAAAFAIGATGWAAFYVADLRADRDALRSQLEELAAAEAVPQPQVMPAALVIEPIAEADEEINPPMPVETPIESAATQDEDSSPPPPNVRPQRPAATPPVSSRAAAPAPAPEPRRPQPPAAELAEPQQQAPARPAPQRPNRTYPGGLPGDVRSQAEPPYIPGRFFPDAPSTRAPIIPDLDLDGLVTRPYPDDHAQRMPTDTLRRDNDQTAQIRQLR